MSIIFLKNRKPIPLSLNFHTSFAKMSDNYPVIYNTVNHDVKIKYPFSKYKNVMLYFLTDNSYFSTSI